MTRRTQALIAAGLLVAGVLLAWLGSAVSWFAELAPVLAGLGFALAVVFLLRAVLHGPARDWLYWRSR